MNYMEKTIKLDNKNTKMVAHRGFRKVEVENTLQAFNLAANSTAYGIECDVHATKDGKFVVIHDHELERLAGIQGKVEEMTFDELRSIALIGKNGEPDKNYRIPTLEEYINACKSGNKRAVLEIKAVNYENSKLIAKIVDSLEYIDNTTFISFQADSLDAVRELFPNAEIQFLTNDFDVSLIPMLVTKKWDLDILYSSITKERIDALHELGIKVNVWTVNEKDVAELLIFWGIDYITSDIFE